MAKSKPTATSGTVLETMLIKDLFAAILKRYGEDAIIPLKSANLVDFMCSNDGTRGRQQDPYKLKEFE